MLYRLISIKQCGATKTTAAKVMIQDLSNKKRKWLPLDYSKPDGKSQAIEYLTKRGITIIGHATDEVNNKHIVITSNLTDTINDR